MNNSGQITGDLLDPFVGIPASHAFLYSDGQMQDLGVLRPGEATFAEAINNFGEVVGRNFSQDPSRGSIAFVYSNGKLIDLNSLLSHRDASRVKLLEAVAINNNGQILVSSGGHSYVLTCHMPGQSKQCTRFIP